MFRGKYCRFLLILFILCFCGCSYTLGADVPNMPINQTIQPVTPQPVDFSACRKFYKLNSQNLFYLTLASINANKFTIDEIQSKSGYILFTAANKQFLASIVNIDSKNSMIKITPCNNVYYFSVGIVQNMFKYIDLNIDTNIEKISIL